MWSKKRDKLTAHDCSRNETRKQGADRGELGLNGTLKDRSENCFWGLANTKRAMDDWSLTQREDAGMHRTNTQSIICITAIARLDLTQSEYVFA